MSATRAKNASPDQDDTPLARRPRIRSPVVTRDVASRPGRDRLQDALVYAAGVRSTPTPRARTDSVRVRGTIPTSTSTACARPTATTPHHRTAPSRGSVECCVAAGICSARARPPASQHVQQSAADETQREFGGIRQLGRKQSSLPDRALSADGAALTAYRLHRMPNAGRHVPDDRSLIAPR